MKFNVTVLAIYSKLSWISIFLLSSLALQNNSWQYIKKLYVTPWLERLPEKWLIANDLLDTAIKSRYEGNLHIIGFIPTPIVL